MFATRTMRLEWEIVKWLAILALAGALAWLLVAQTAAGATPGVPALLPREAMDAAAPMKLVDPNIQLAKIVAAHQQGDPEMALNGWRQVQLPPETEVWRQIAMGVAQLQMGKLDEAGEHLMKAEDAAPQNPIVHYYLGLLRLDQARQAHEWYDAIGPQIRLVAYRPHLVVPNTRGMYELVAMQELEQAIENAGMFDRTIVLAMPDYRVGETVPAITTGDLVMALGCEKFEGQAHNILGAMYLDRRNADLAEEHMDAATAAGQDIVFGYRDLGAVYEHAGRHADAARAYLKALKEEPGKVYPLQKLLENAGKTLFE